MKIALSSVSTSRRLNASDAPIKQKRIVWVGREIETTSDKKEKEKEFNQVRRWRQCSGLSAGSGV